MPTDPIPRLITPGIIASELGVPLHRVQHVLGTRTDILPKARAGTLRLYYYADINLVRQELSAIDARRGA